MMSRIDDSKCPASCAPNMRSDVAREDWRRYLGISKRTASQAVSAPERWMRSASNTRLVGVSDATRDSATKSSFERGTAVDAHAAIASVAIAATPLERNKRAS